MEDSSKWIIEKISPYQQWCFAFRKELQSCVTDFQRVDLVDTIPFGKTLMIDGVLQSSELDQHIYHDCLVHPAMLLHPNPKRIFIGGGGEGATVREVLKHKSVEKVVFVDIDIKVLEFCEKHLDENKHIWKDPRVEIIVDDALKVLKESEQPFDVIIIDLDDPLEGGPCYNLYTKSFYEFTKTKLTSNGILVTQSAAAGIRSLKAVFSPVYNTLRQVFPGVRAYYQHIFSFSNEWGFNMGFCDPKLASLPSSEELDERIKERLLPEQSLQFLDGITFHKMFILPKYMRAAFESETKVLGENSLAFAFGAGVNK